jgi:3-phenylpropionate/trans-cinnamate dioxygenase ferredoxin reductase component
MTAGMVIVGAGMAGHRAVISLRASGYEGPITVIGEEQHLPYDRPPLSKSAITEDAEPQPVWLMDEGIVSSLKADVKPNCTATAIDRVAKSVATTAGQIPYDKLLIATGAKPRKLNMPGGEHALLLRNFEDAIALRKRFQPGKNIVVIGGGFIGLELASSATKRGCNVTLIEAQPRILMRGVPEAIAKIVHDRHVSADVRMMVGTALKSLQADSVTLSDDSTIPADTIIAGIGAAPETKLAAQAGLTLDNGIACNEFLQTSDENIFAAGDCCSFLHPHFDNMRIRLEAWRNAQDQGSLVAENMLGVAKSYKAIPWFWSDQYDLSLQVAGMPNLGPVAVARTVAPQTLILFHLTTEGQLRGVSAVGPGNTIARDVKLAEMLIAKSASPSAAQLADPSVQLKSLLKG